MPIKCSHKLSPAKMIRHLRNLSIEDTCSVSDAGLEEIVPVSNIFIPKFDKNGFRVSGWPLCDEAHEWCLANRQRCGLRRCGAAALRRRGGAFTYFWQRW